MNLTLSLSPDESAKLQRRAAVAGTDVRTFLLHVIHDVDDAAVEMASAAVPYDEWHQTFQEWLSLISRRIQVWMTVEKAFTTDANSNRYECSTPFGGARTRSLSKPR